MQRYDSTAISKLAATLDTVADLVFAALAVLGILTAIVSGFMAVASGIGADAKVLGVGVALLAGAAYALLGWIISLGLKAAGQLLLAVVQIELNTRQPLESDVAPAVTAARPDAARLPVASTDGGFLVCPSCGKKNPAGTNRCQWCFRAYAGGIES
jgi:hypothetical protein